MSSSNIHISPSLYKRRVGMSSITLNKMVATKAGNKGWDAALSAIEMVNLLGKI